MIHLALSSISSLVPCLLLALAAVPSAAGLGELEELIERYESKAASVRTKMETAGEIAALGGKKAREFLEEACLRAKPAILKRAVFDAMREHLAPVSTDLLEEAVLDNDAYLRAHALELLHGRDPAALRGRLRDALTFDEDARVRGVALGLLAAGADAETARVIFESSTGSTPPEQRKAIAALSALPPDVFDEVLGGEEPRWAAREDDPELRLLGPLVLANRVGDDLKKPLTRLSKDRDPRVRFAAALGLDRLSSRGKGKAARRAMNKAKAAEEHLSILEVVLESGLDDPELTEILIEELDHRDWRVRAAAAEALGSTGAAESVEPLVSLLHDEKHWQVQIACLRALGISRQAAAVGILIERLDQLEGRLAHEAGRALSTLTGMSLGHRTSSWTRWWADHREGFEPPSPELAQWADVEEPSETYAFYGIPVFSNRLAFVLDVSGSMGGPKLERLKKELEVIIERLPDHAKLNMVFFETNVHPWRRRLQPLTAENREAAREEVRECRAEGATNLWEGLLEAFEDEEVDTIYLLSDGEPTAGAVTNLASICKEIGSINRYRRVAIHVVLIGLKSRHLRRLALESGGTYVQHDV